MSISNNHLIGQTIYEIGTGTIDNNIGIPISGHWTLGRAQITETILRLAPSGGTTATVQDVYLPSDPPGSGMQAAPIISLGWNIVSSNPAQTGTLNIYLKNVASPYPDLSTSNTWGGETSGATLFFSGTVTTPTVPGWWMITGNQATPFSYNGGCLIIITSYMSSTSQLQIKTYFTTLSNIFSYVQNYSNFSSPQNGETFSNAIGTAHPNMRFGIGASCTNVSINLNPSSPSAVCEGGGSASMTVSVTGTPPYNYQWQINNGGTWINLTNGGGNPYNNTAQTTSDLSSNSLTITNPSYSLNGKEYRCVITNCSGAGSATSASAILTVNPNLPVSITAAAGTNPVCSGTAVTFTATPTNGGSTPSYQWKVNGTNQGTNSTGFTYTPNNSDVITCELSSNAVWGCLKSPF